MVTRLTYHFHLKINIGHISKHPFNTCNVHVFIGFHLLLSLKRMMYCSNNH